MNYQTHLQEAEITRRTGFGETVVRKTEKYIVQVGEASYNVNGDGTLTDLTNRLQWIQAPWGMMWNGENFVGTPVNIDWKKATSLFGKGSKVKGWEKDGDSMGVLKPELMDASKYNSDYKKGKCIVEFAGHNDWRLPTCIEFHKSLCFNVSPFDKWTAKKYRYEYIKLLIKGTTYKFWTSNARKYGGIIESLGIDHGVAWRAELWNDGDICDDQKQLKFNLLFVREI